MSPMVSSQKSSSKAHMLGTPASKRNFAPDASLVLVGIRGSGKRSLGFIAAAALNRRFITEDYYFKEVTGLTRHEFLLKFGSHEFQRRDVEVLKMMLDNHRMHCVIECGLGSLTRIIQEYLRRYALSNPVVYILRDMDQIQRLLQLQDSSAKRLGNGDPYHRRCSNFEYYNLEERVPLELSLEEGTPDRRSVNYSFKLKDAKEDFTQFVRFITGATTTDPGLDSPFVLLETPPERRSYTHAVLLRFSALHNTLVDLEKLESGGDAIELCIDMWNPDAVSAVAKNVSVLRRIAKLPIIYSIDAEALGIETPVSDPVARKNSDLYFQILEYGLRLGVEYLSIHLEQDHTRLTQIVQSRGTTKVIGHFTLQNSSGISWDDEACLSIYLEAERLGCQLVRIVRPATTREENDSVRKFVDRVKALSGTHPPIIAFNIGPIGRSSQVFNANLTSVTHPAIPPSTRRGNDPQITSQDAVRALVQSYMLDPLKFYILGASVAYSISPIMHNAAYASCGLSHVYRIPDAPSLALLDEWRHDPHFGGSSVVQPWRVHVAGQLKYKSRHAEAIGAINTIMPLRASADGNIYPLSEQASRRNEAGHIAAWWGENTDWISIMVCLRRNLSPRNAISPVRTTGLVIGAGGMARAAIYAMLHLGCRKIFILNRTLSRAEEVARHFNSWASSSHTDSDAVIRVLRSAEEPWPSDLAFPSMIVSCVPENRVQDQPPANFVMPLQWLGSPSGGVVIELAYNSLDTPLVRQLRRYRQETNISWVLIDGLEVVAEQGFAQWELMTGRKAPRRLMMTEVLKHYVGENGRLDEKTVRARLDAFSG
ncbi:repressor protein [Talaromyces stipitatus ATCC 10500]|uniref:Repressor protein n=1 Tax=Talaromyces stipitatus (strain ATCC 10500 / CBS 375.48 / QM 6759 / NRRL 1006) TaxID=441959 RepID=B8MG67_TALSN|nr:repressor protein [Talaromyces stipitatus ATCC 10500]EED15934.1 repressor protein [Talaromyces stipitatus ATCC 10500]